MRGDEVEIAAQPDQNLIFVNLAQIGDLERQPEPVAPVRSAKVFISDAATSRDLPPAAGDQDDGTLSRAALARKGVSEPPLFTFGSSWRGETAQTLHRGAGNVELAHQAGEGALIGRAEHEHDQMNAGQAGVRRWIERWTGTFTFPLENRDAILLLQR